MENSVRLMGINVASIASGPRRVFAIRAVMIMAVEYSWGHTLRSDCSDPTGIRLRHYRQGVSCHESEGQEREGMHLHAVVVRRSMIWLYPNMATARSLSIRRWCVPFTDWQTKESDLWRSDWGQGQEEFAMIRSTARPVVYQTMTSFGNSTVSRFLSKGNAHNVQRV
jgi:hypothetical protein